MLYTILQWTRYGKTTQLTRESKSAIDIGLAKEAFRNFTFIHWHKYSEVRTNIVGGPCSSGPMDDIS